MKVFGESLFYPYNVQVNKCSGSCNTLDNPIEKLCVPNVIKGLNMKVYNFLTMLMKLVMHYGMKVVNVFVN